MEAGGWGGDTPLQLRIDGLITRLVELSRRPVDIRRQRQLSEASHGFVSRETNEPDPPIPVRQDLESLNESARPQLHLLTGLQGRTRLAECHPRPVRARMDQQNFGWRPGFSPTQKSGVPNFRGIENDEVARSDQRR